MRVVSVPADRRVVEGMRSVMVINGIPSVVSFDKINRGYLCSFLIRGSVTLSVRPCVRQSGSFSGDVSSIGGRC